MKKLLFLTLVLLLFSTQFLLTAATISSSFAYNGSDFLMGSVCGEYPLGRNIGLGIDIYGFQSEIGQNSKQNSHATSINGIKNFQFSTINCQLMLGFGVSQSFYDDIKSDLSYSPNIGLAGSYKISKKMDISGKALFFIYSDGFTAPYSVGLDYQIGRKYKVTIGVSGKEDFTTSGGETFTDFKLGGMAGIKYSF